MAARLNSVQVLRAVAVLMVLQVHLFPEFPYWGRPLDGGFGVDLFFIISGFVIAGSLAQVESRTGAVHFLINRFSRVAPYYWLVTLGLAFGLAHIGYPVEREKLLRSLLFYPIDPHPILAGGWTLCHEAFFYVFYGLCALVLGKGLVRLTTLLFLIVLVAVHFIPGHSYPLEFLKSSMNLYFVVGAAISMGGERLLEVFRRPFALPAAVLLMLVAALYCGSRGLGVPTAHDFFLSTYARDVVDIRVSFVQPGFPRAFVFGLPAALLLLCCLAREDLFKSEKWRFWLKIGDASYSIYLLQGLFLTLVVINVANHRPLSRLLMLGVIVSVSILLSRAVEARLIRATKWLLKLLVPRRS
ncbi:MAG: acyltransferase [Lacunisphaera sp.]|nr:acyltransferase [Lacunisphaera sp.]